MPMIDLTSSTTSSGAPAKGLQVAVSAATSRIFDEANVPSSFMARISQRLALESITPEYARFSSASDRKCARTTKQAYTTAILSSLAYLKTSGRTTAKLMSDAVSCLSSNP